MIKQESIKVTVAQADDGLRLEVFLAKHVEGLSRRKAIELIREGFVWIGNIKARKGMMVSVGQKIEIQIPHTDTDTHTNPEVLFSNNELVIVNKPAGMPCHPLRLGETGTLLQWVGERFPEVLKAGKDIREGGLLHRLDTDTSGCVAFARTQEAYSKWAPKFLEGGIGKIYLAVVADCGSNGGSNCGSNGGSSGGSNRCTCCANFPGNEINHPKLPHIGKSVVVKIPLGRHPSDAGRMVALIHGEERHKGPALSAKTTIRTLAKGDGCALVEATIERGRMHQIRVHLAAIGHPILGDKTYGGSDCGSSCGSSSSYGTALIYKKRLHNHNPSHYPSHNSCSDMERQALHAYRLVVDGIETIAPLPKDFRELCKKKELKFQIL